MEVPEQSAVERPDDEATVSSLSPPASPTADPLADVSCLHCGYSLRGLIEHRCPECGMTFDPQEMASSYLPEWPRLMIWYLMAAWVTGFLEVVSHGLWIVASRGSVLSALEARGMLPYLFEPVVTLMIAPSAIIGLMRRTDWGRKAAIGLFVVQSLPLLPVSVYVIYKLVSPSPYVGFSVVRILDFIPACVLAAQVSLPSIILACVLATRLRRRSLRRSALNPPLLLPRTAFSPRNDWPLVLVVLLAAGALTQFGSLGTAALWLIALLRDSRSFGSSWSNTLTSMVCRAFLAALQCGWLIWIAREIWRNPVSTKRRLKSFLVVAVASSIAGPFINVILRPEVYSSSSPESTVLRISGVVTYALASLAIPLALYLYSLRALPPEAIARVAKPQTQAATPLGRSLAES